MSRALRPRPPLEDDIRSILDSVRSLVRALRVASRASEKQYGLSSAQLFVLQSLSDSSGMSVNELAERTRTHQSTVSGVVSRLVEQNLVARNASPEDGRRVELSLTPRGSKLLARSPKTIQEQLIAALARMPETKRRELASLLSEMLDEAGLSEGTPPLFFEEEKP